MKKQIYCTAVILLCCFSLIACGTVDGIAAQAPNQREVPLQTSTIVEKPTNKSPNLAKEEQIALSYLENRLNENSEFIYVYSDFAAMSNNFTQKAKIGSGTASFVDDMDENCDGAYNGSSAITCRVNTKALNWGGWMFLNGYLPKGETVPRLDFGELPNAGLDLTGATKLTFMAKGEKGGEIVEFFTAGLGYDGANGNRIAPYPDSSTKRNLLVKLTKDWKEYIIDLRGSDLSSIGCGFGFVVSGANRQGETLFYLDEIRFGGDIITAKTAPRLIQSYEINTKENSNGVYVQNAAFSYDNALAAMAFIAAGKQEQAKDILDAFIFAVENDRYKPDRLRNAYAYGNISPFPGWESGTRLPGWYDADAKAYYEDQYQVGTNVGNSSYVALALLQYQKTYGGEEYLNLAKTLMDWVLTRIDKTPGFTGGYDGWPEAGEVTEYTYKSIEHNIDAYAAFRQLYAVTGEGKYKTASENALQFIKSMYDPKERVFYTGTLPDGITPNKENIVLDAQVWCALALGDDFTPYLPALERVVDMQTAEGGFPFHEANINGGYWLEGTAFTALCLKQFGIDAPAQKAFAVLKAAQLPTGGFPAATVKALTTGFTLFTGDPWVYGKSPHIAPTAWFVMAAQNFNPYQF